MCFKPYQNEHNSVKEAKERGEKKKKTWQVGPKIPMKILFPYPPNFVFN